MTNFFACCRLLCEDCGEFVVAKFKTFFFSWRVEEGKVATKNIHQEFQIPSPRTSGTALAQTKARLVLAEKEEKLTREWVHVSPIIERGSILLSTPGDHFWASQQYFHKAIILIVEHDPGFTTGVILNRPGLQKHFPPPLPARQREKRQCHSMFTIRDTIITVSYLIFQN